LFKDATDILVAAQILALNCAKGFYKDGDSHSYFVKALFEKTPHFWWKLEMVITGKFYYSLNGQTVVKGRDKCFEIFPVPAGRPVKELNTFIQNQMAQGQGLGNISLGLS